eukprot:TRINITY_DN203_c0_g1_i2.p1 TRINITY_DN203_c0_g1~~TRINITY_DN203_c0_g1_i2.p1  ORF type:complete len:358 (+),score=33.63 TRINITY_DN203_c0_g1_i2:236-1309(+)
MDGKVQQMHQLGLYVILQSTEHRLYTVDELEIILQWVKTLESFRDQALIDGERTIRYLMSNELFNGPFMDMLTIQPDGICKRVLLTAMELGRLKMGVTGFDPIISEKIISVFLNTEDPILQKESLKTFNLILLTPERDYLLSHIDIMSNPECIRVMTNFLMYDESRAILAPLLNWLEYVTKNSRISASNDTLAALSHVLFTADRIDYKSSICKTLSNMSLCTPVHVFLEHSDLLECLITISDNCDPALIENIYLFFASLFRRGQLKEIVQLLYGGGLLPLLRSLNAGDNLLDKLDLCKYLLEILARDSNMQSHLVTYLENHSFFQYLEELCVTRGELLGELSSSLVYFRKRTTIKKL